MDNYILQNYPENHAKYTYAVAQKAYWKDFFLHSRPNRAGKKLDKGFIEIIFRKDDE